MAISNYDTAQEQARQLFLRYDQRSMTERFALRWDDTSIFLPLVGRTYEVNRHTGSVIWRGPDGTPVPANYNAAMSVYDVLCCSKPLCRASGRYAPINAVARSFHSSGLGDTLFDKWAEYFSRAPHRLDAACRALGGRKDSKGDIAYELDTFPFLPVLLRYWEADDEFPASAQLLWDTNTLDFVHYETTYYMAGLLFSRLRELMEQP